VSSAKTTATNAVHPVIINQ